MMRQYAPQRHRIETVGSRRVPVGTLRAGTIVRLPTGRAIVEAWFPREIGAGAREGGRWVSRFMARGGHLAQVRMLGSGEIRRVSDAWFSRA